MPARFSPRFLTRLTARLSLLALLAFALTGCAAPPRAAALAPGAPEQLVRLQADSTALRRAARQTLNRYRIGVAGDDNNTAALLQLNEKVTTRAASLAADGSVGSYKIEYVLSYQFAAAARQTIRREYEVNHDENAYLAERNQRDNLVYSLRADALEQMVVFLQP